jgi:subtilisin family serine protease
MGDLGNKAGTLAFMVVLGVLAVGCTEEAQDLFTDTYIVKLGAEPGDVASEVVSIQEDFASIFEFEPLHIFQEVTQGFQVVLPIGLVESIEGLDEVEYVIIDNPKDYYPPPGTEEPNLGDGETPEGLERIGWDIGLIGDVSSVEVAVVDTGIDLGHPDLNVVGTYDAVGEGGGDDSGGDDLNGHGTHVAGTIGAVADGTGVVGVAPGVGLHAVRVLDADGGGTLGDIIAGLEYVALNEDIRVVNMSLGGAADPDDAPALGEAIQTLEDKGVVVCIAAGNETEDTAGYIPAGFDIGVIVSAYDADGGYNGFADFSNYGGEVDISAPGVNITSTLPEDMSGYDGYGALSGTSMATPHVAGAAAAYLSIDPGASAADVVDALLDSADQGYADPGDDHPEGFLDFASLMQ